MEMYENNELNVSWREVALVYLKIGTIGFGGGYAVINLIHSELVEKHHWLTEQGYQDMLSIAQMAPGALTVNILSGIAFRLGGIKTMLLATAALIMPSFFLILLLASLFFTWQHNPVLNGAMEGLTAGVVGLMLAVVWKLVRKLPQRWYYYASGASAFLLSLFTGVNPIWLVLLGGASGATKFLVERVYFRNNSAH